MTDTFFAKAASIILLFAAGLHMTRIITKIDFSFFPVWASGVMTVLLVYCVVQRIRYQHNAAPAFWGEIPYNITTVVMTIALVAHGFRALIEPTLFSYIPLWLSYIAVPATIILAIYNYSVNVTP